MRTFVEVLRDNSVYTDKAHEFVRLDGTQVRLTFPELWATACQRAHRFHELGLKKGDRVALILPEPDDFVLAFMGALTAGLVPVPMFPPVTLAKMDAYGETVRHILQASGAQALVTVPGLKDMLETNALGADSDLRILVESELHGERMERPTPPCKVTLEDTAFLQFTSGSTRKPKGVVVSHGNLSYNAHAIMFDGLKATSKDKGVSWLPLYHDMGLIGFVIAPLYAQVQVTFIQTMNFIRRPASWLDAIDRFRGTITFAPNFAYALATRAISKKKSEGWDLSCLKAMGCGAEPIERGVLEKFVERFAENGMKRSALLPCYGLAEATLAVSFSDLGSSVTVDVVDQDSLKGGVAKASADEPKVEVVSCGKPFPLHEVKIIDEAGTKMVDRVVGEICVRGPSITTGYFNNPEATAEVYVDGWLRTGDLGYLADGEIHICGRAKDLIILNGKNYYPQDIERVAADHLGLRQDQCVAFGRRGPNGEECAIVIEAVKKDFDVVATSSAIVQSVRSTLGITVAEVVFIKRNTMPKTSSGKVRRRFVKQRQESGGLELHVRTARQAVPMPRASQTTL